MYFEQNLVYMGKDIYFLEGEFCYVSGDLRIYWCIRWDFKGNLWLYF